MENKTGAVCEYCGGIVGLKMEKYRDFVGRRVEAITCLGCRTEWQEELRAEVASIPADGPERDAYFSL